MEEFIASIERCPDTELYVGYVPNLPGAHSQGETIDGKCVERLRRNSERCKV